MHGTSVIWFVVLLVVGILAVNGIVWTFIILWWRRRSRDARAQLAAAIEGESVIRPPLKGNYRGATAPGYPAVSGNGLIALSRQRLVFLTLTGKWIEIPLTAITSLRESKVFKASAAGGHMHLLVGTGSGEIGFFVPDNAAWINAIAQACPRVGAARAASQAGHSTPLVVGRRRRGRAAFPILAIVFASVGLLLGLVAGIGAAVVAGSVSGDQSGDGTVVDFSYDGRSYSPVVEFVPPNAAPVRFTSGVGSNPPSYDVGEHVGVLYDPGNPPDAKINEYWQIWFLPTLLGIIGTPFLLMGTAFGVVTLVGRVRSHSKSATSDDDSTQIDAATPAAVTGEREARD